MARSLLRITLLGMNARLIKKLMEHFSADYVRVCDDSHKHKHFGRENSHFSILVVSSKFKGMTLLKRHQSIHNLFSEELAGTIHALKIKASTPEEYQGAG